MQLPEKEGAHRKTWSAVQKNVWIPAIYPTFSLNANDCATAIIGDRHRIPRHVARVICELANLGERQ